MLQGGCPQGGMGFELGFTFALPGSQQASAASAVSLPEQVYQAGLIQDRVLLQDPVRASSTSGAASTNKFRSAVQGASVPVFGSSTPWSANYTGGSNGTVTVLWDTGAEGMLMVPSDVFAAFQAYYTAASQQVKANTSFNITSCDAASFCGHSTPTGNDAAYACQSIALPADAPAGTLAAAQQALLSMYPPSVDVLLQGGATAAIPGAVLVNDCTGPDYSQTSGVAACSYIRGPVGDMGQNFWAASPFFTGRFVQFNATGGIMRFSDPIPSCDF
ncbi:hypothetical protein COHA_006682 [Chlorella ohadii]|uniref:Uncharacterized protein n=1 Tax=Chlorella ohadii TaxID=2649997 RepID=A0AAD5H454_9CHLO|nr:hypothetical protein COHA_006682 [Chlorella ohadii]